MKRMIATSHIIFLLLVLLVGASPSLAQEESGGDLLPYLPPQGRITAHSYANLSELVVLVCDDAMAKFHQFFGPTAVAVRPFSVISDYLVKDTTMLGVTLADQMTNMINSTAVPEYTVAVKYPQQLSGVISEIDGFLRIHISGRNVRGERRSYAVSVEMSEPIYRAMHSYVKSY